MSMTRKALLDRCLPILEAVKVGEPVEDSFVELKSELPEDAKAARGLAGSANAAGGEPVIWLVGIDEKAHKVIGAQKAELSAWYPCAARCFDGPAPKLGMVENIRDGKQTVVAMVFETEEAPYVVSRGPDSRDIPWREGNRTRSAYRQEILRMLAAHSLLPVVDITEAAFLNERDNSGQVIWIRFEAVLYVKPQNERTLVFPRHDCKVYVQVPGSLPWTPFDDIRLFAAVDNGTRIPAHVSVDGPGPLLLVACIGPVFGFDGQKVKVKVSLRPVNSTRPVVGRHEMTLQVEPKITKVIQRKGPADSTLKRDNDEKLASTVSSAERHRKACSIG